MNGVDKHMNNSHLSKTYLIVNEVLNAVTHGIGAVLSTVGLVFLIFKALDMGSSLKLIAYIVYLNFTLSELNAVSQFEVYEGQIFYAPDGSCEHLPVNCRNVYALHAHYYWRNYRNYSDYCHLADCLIWSFIQSILVPKIPRTIDLAVYRYGVDFALFDALSLSRTGHLWHYLVGGRRFSLYDWNHFLQLKAG